MTFLTLSLAMALASQSVQDCAPPVGPPLEPRVFTNADLDRMAACRYQTGAESKAETHAPGRSVPPSSRRSAKGAKADPSTLDGAEANWRAQWRSIDLRARRLRLEAKELRQEAAQAPRDPKKQPLGKRSPSLLISRASGLEAEAKELEDEFQERARREGALPGWLRPKTH